MNHVVLLTRCLGFAVLGAIPGMLILFVPGIPRTGIAVAVLGALIGAAFGIPGVSPSRTFRLLAATIIVRNVPTAGHRAMDWVDADDPASLDEEGDLSAKLFHWLSAPHVEQRRGWLVLVGLVSGLALGATIAIHDILAVRASKPGWYLPIRGANDSIETQGVLLTLLAVIWIAALAGIVASAAYRRPIVFAGCFGGGIFGLVGYAAGAPPIGFFFTTGAIALALIVAACMGLENGEDL